MLGIVKAYTCEVAVIMLWIIVVHVISNVLVISVVFVNAKYLPSVLCKNLTPALYLVLTVITYYNCCNVVFVVVSVLFSPPWPVYLIIEAKEASQLDGLDKW